MFFSPIDGLEWDGMDQCVMSIIVIPLPIVFIKATCIKIVALMIQHAKEESSIDRSDRLRLHVPSKKWTNQRQNQTLTPNSIITQNTAICKTRPLSHASHSSPFFCTRERGRDHRPSGTSCRCKSLDHSGRIRSRS